tara:strand:- start:92 stop:415 length:324 start_codon:yes stop_codon:yes gene_type:complete
MPTAENNITIQKKNDLIILTLSSLAITSFFLYADEGMNSFTCMKTTTGWLTLMLYSTIFLSGQLLFSRVVLKKHNSLLRITLSIILGSLLIITVLGVLLVLGRYLLN